MTIESLVVKICDLAERNNQLVNLIGKIQSGEAVYISGEDPAAQIADGQMPQGGGMQNPQMQFVGENPLPQAPPQQNAAVSSEMTYAPITANGYTFTGGSRGAAPQNIPRSTGGTGGHAQRQMFIPKSQVEKMTREEIRQMFDVIDKSRKEW